MNEQTVNFAPLSESPVWAMQRRYFEEQGIEAWRSWEVPHYITNNPTVAHAYAEIIFGYLRDHARLYPDATEPVRILELGGGSGRLAFYTLTYLQALCEQAAFSVPRYCYILSDLPQANIDFWRHHRSLRGFVERGVLDFARFDMECDDRLQLIEADQTIEQGSLAHPLLLIANYVLDSVPQDLFYFKQGESFVCKVGLRTTSEDLNGGGVPTAWLKRQKLLFEYEPLAASHYEEEAFNEQLAAYASLLNDSHVLFPVVGLRCLERLRGLSRQGFILLSADKGSHRLDLLDSWVEPPDLVHHGSFSLNVNYHAIQSYYERYESKSYFPSHHHRHLNVGCIVMTPAGTAVSYTEVALAYGRFVERFGPDDLYSFKQMLSQQAAVMSFPHMLSILRLSGYDPQLFKQCSNKLMHLLDVLSAADKQDLLLVIHRVWQGYYWIGEEQDLAFDIAMMLYTMQFYGEAAVFFERSVEDYGAGAPAWFNLALCSYQLSDWERTRRYVEACLELEPEHADAKALKVEISGLLAQEGRR